MAKKRVALRLSDDEVAVVGPKERWLHLISIYEAYADDPDYYEGQDAWLAAADWIRSALKAAEPKETYDEEGDWK